MFRKKKENQIVTKIITKNLKLSNINIELYFARRDGTNSYQATIKYAENPRAYESGVEQSEKIEAKSWPELRGVIDELLGDPQICVPPNNEVEEEKP